MKPKFVAYTIQFSDQEKKDLLDSLKKSIFHPISSATLEVYNHGSRCAKLYDKLYEEFYVDTDNRVLPGRRDTRL